MSHQVLYPITPFEELSMEEQLVYIETHLEEVIAEIRADDMIPPWDKEALVNSMRRARSQFEGGIELEEFLKEFMKELA